MKKNFLKAAFVAAFAIAAGYGVYTAQTETKLSDLALDNVEALANDSESSGRGCTADRNAICETSRNDYVDYRNN